jgi:hypothetical protein
MLAVRRSRSAEKKSSTAPEVLKIKFLPLGSVVEYPGADLDIFAKCDDDNPAIVFAWNDATVAAVLHQIVAMNPRPAWFPYGNTTDQFKDAIVNHVRTVRGRGMGHFRNAIIAPLTLPNTQVSLA